MGIYSVIKERSIGKEHKVAVSITMDNREKRSYTYKELFEKADIFCEKLEKCGVVKGDRIIIAAENSPEWNIAYLAIMKLKCTAVLIDISLTSEDIIKLIEKSDARCIYSSPKVMTKFKGAPSDKIPTLNIMDNGNPFEESVKVVSPELGKTIDGDEEVAFIIYSSGTTKSASGIMHTHKAMIETLDMTAKENNIHSEDKILGVLPCTHIYGVVTCLLGSMALGGSIEYIDSMNSENLLYGFREFKPTVFSCVPKVFDLFEKEIVKKIKSKSATKKLYEIFFPMCLNLRKNTGINLGKVIFKSVHKGFGGNIKIMTSAGAPLDESVAEFYYGMGFTLVETYGLTETNIPVIGNRGKNITTNSCGKPYPGIEIKLANKDENGAGELYVKSPYVMKGYFRDEQATKEAFDGEWFKTGDMVMYDEKQNIKIVGRNKENIVLATGKKVTPTDIEVKYGAINGVSDLVICGVPVSGKDYDEVHAFVVKENKNVSEEDIIKEIQEKGASLSLYMKIAKIHFLDDIPKTSLQKPKRYLLKKHALENTLVNTKKDEVKEEEVQDINSTLINMVSTIGGIEKDRIKLESKIIGELGMDSLSIIEFSSQIEEKYSVDISKQFKEGITLSDIKAIIEDPSNVKQGILSEIRLKKKHTIHYAIFKAHCILANTLYKVKTRDDKYIPKDSGYIICANHVSNIDYLWLTMKFKKKQFSNFCCMAKKELFNKSFISNLLVDTCGMIPVDRGGMNAEVLKCCKEKLSEKWGLLIHPEGTRSLDGKLGKIKKGAATIAKEANVPIIPAYIKGAYEIFPKGKKMPKFFDWKKFKRFRVEVVYGEPIYPQDLTVEEITELVQKSIASLA